MIGGKYDRQKRWYASRNSWFKVFAILLAITIALCAVWFIGPALSAVTAFTGLSSSFIGWAAVISSAITLVDGLYIESKDDAYFYKWKKEMHAELARIKADPNLSPEDKARAEEMLKTPSDHMSQLEHQVNQDVTGLTSTLGSFIKMFTPKSLTIGLLSIAAIYVGVKIYDNKVQRH